MVALWRTAAAGALVVLAGAARALTAEELWQDWQDGATRLGDVTVETGDERREDGRLTVTGLQLTLQGEDGALVARVPEAVFEEIGEGRVALRLPESYPVEITGTDPEGVETVVALTVRQQGLEVTASGAPGAVRYDYAAGRYAVALERLTEDGAVRPVEAELALDAPKGSYLATTEAGGLRRTAYDLDAAALSLSFDGADPDIGTTSALDATLDEVALSGDLAMPEGIAEAQSLPEGFALAFDYAAGPARIAFSGDGPRGRAAGTAVTEGGTVTLSLDPERLAYDSRTAGLALRLDESPLPFPVALGVAEYGVAIDAPIRGDAAPQEAAARLTLDGLALGDPLWALFDPQAVLPRTPATLIAELSARVVLPRDLADPETAEALGDEATATEALPRIDSLALERLVLRLAGAELLGDGAFTFDNADLETFPGFPRPEGRLDLRATGLNALIENLATLGVIPAEQLMGVRMMLGLFTTPVGRDELTSEIEVNPEGHVIANGQRLR